MKVFLSPELAGHRHGRFLAGLLDAANLENQPLPDAGLLLAMGGQFQEMALEERQRLDAWLRLPGRTVLLLPPFQEGPVREDLDWQIRYRMAAPSAQEASLPALLAPEVAFELAGQAGESDGTAGHLWPDHTLNTRWFRAHSGSGVFAATCLPLWSISLLDQAGPVRDWLQTLHSHAGREQPAAMADIPAPATLEPEDFTVLVCCHAWDSTEADALRRKATATPIPLFDFARLALDTRLAQLENSGHIDPQGITALGLEALRGSPYWPYAERLKEEPSP